MKKFFLKASALATAGALPLVTFAQSANPNHLFSIVDALRLFLNRIIPILIVAAIIYFIWGVVQYVLVKDIEEKAQARDKMVFGLIGIFVILSIYGIVYFIGSTLGIGQGGSAAIPCVTGTYIPGTGICQ